MLTVPDWSPTPPLHTLRLDWLAEAGVELAVLRLDLIDAELSGNKWYKLRPHLELAARAGRARHRADFWQPWLDRYPELQPVPEGGGGRPGALGCVELVELARRQLPGLGWDDYHGWWLAAGTGTTLAGLVMGEAGQRLVHGALAVPQDHGVERRLAELGVAPGHFRLHAASRGGFARTDEQLLTFMAGVEQAAGLPLEPLYTAKALLALREQVEAGAIRSGTRLIFVHTGGLQGLRGLSFGRSAAALRA